MCYYIVTIYIFSEEFDMTYNSKENKRYFPPLLSNGEISFAPDSEGMINYRWNDYAKKNIKAFDGIVVRSARRTAKCTNLNARLFPFGSFSFCEGFPPQDPQVPRSPRNA